MTSKPTIQNMTSFQAAFDFFNQELFGNSLPQVILNFSRSGSKTIAFYAPKRWQQGEEVSQEALDEISLNPKYLGRTLDKIMSSLVHEQCHLWEQAVSGKPSRRSYHSRQWASKMQEIGLQPDDGTGKETGQRVSHTIIDGGAFQKIFESMPEEFALPWRVFVEMEEATGGEAGKAPATKSKSGKRFKYNCSCGVNIWGKEGLRVICGECEVEFQPVQ